MKKWTIAGVSVLALALAAGCGNSGNGGGAEEPNNGNEAGGSNGETTIHIFQSKVEISEALDRMKQAYESAHPGVTLEIETVIGTDYQTVLKTKFASGTMPDIFMNEGYEQLATWLEHLEDLSDEPWVGDLYDFAKDPVLVDGKMYGMPVNLEGYGLVYNKDLFEQANITELPKTLTELEAVSEQLQNSEITPFVNGFQVWSSLGRRFFNNPVAKQPDPDAFIAQLNEGTTTFAENELFDDAMNLLDLSVQYGNANSLTMDYNTLISSFGRGEGAMMESGNWTMPLLKEIDPDINLGLMPEPINDDVELNDKLFVGVPNNWVMYNKSEVKEEAKQFLNWLVTSDEGKRFIATEFEFIPAFESIPIDPEAIGPMGEDIMEYVEQDKVLGWHWPKYPDGSPQEFAASLQKYVAGRVDRAELYNEFLGTWQTMSQ